MIRTGKDLYTEAFYIDKLSIIFGSDDAVMPWNSSSGVSKGYMVHIIGSVLILSTYSFEAISTSSFNIFEIQCLMLVSLQPLQSLIAPGCQLCEQGGIP